MLIWEQILEELKQGVPLEEIRKKYRSQSQIIKAFRAYVEILSQEISKLLVDVSGFNEELYRLKQICKQFQNEKKELSKEVQNLKEKREKLQQAIEVLIEKVDDLQNNINEFERKGFTSKVVSILQNTWVESGDEALEVLKDRSKAERLKSKLQQLKENISNAKDTLGSLEKKIKEKSVELKSLINEVDQAKAEKILYLSVFNVIDSALKRGYTPSQLERLLVGLEKAEIKDKPGLSIERLLEIFFEAKNFVNLKKQNEVVESKVEALLLDERKVQSRIEFKKVIVERFYEELMEKGKETFESTGKSVEEIWLSMITGLEERIIAAEKAAFESGLKKGRAEELEQILDSVMVLIGLKPSEDIKKDVSPQLILSLLQGIFVWTNQKYPSERAKVYFNTLTGEYQPAKFPVKAPRIDETVLMLLEQIKQLEKNKKN